jgi:hypothetical protein
MLWTATSRSKGHPDGQPTRVAWRSLAADAPGSARRIASHAQAALEAAGLNPRHPDPVAVGASS